LRNRKCSPGRLPPYSPFTRATCAFPRPQGSRPLFVERSVHHQIHCRQGFVAGHEPLTEIAQEVVLTRFRPLWWSFTVSTFIGVLLYSPRKNAHVIATAATRGVLRLRPQCRRRCPDRDSPIDHTHCQREHG